MPAVQCSRMTADANHKDVINSDHYFRCSRKRARKFPDLFVGRMSSYASIGMSGETAGWQSKADLKYMEDHSVRVLTGDSGSRKLSSGVSGLTRPTTARVRKSIFDIVWSRVGIEGKRFLDLFAGTGAMGIEALSRGAEEVYFVDNSRVAINVVRDNLKALNIAPSRHRVIFSDYESFFQNYDGREFDVAFLDPPYSFREWSRLVERVPSAILVCESDRSVEIPADMTKILERKYGTTRVTLVAKSS